MKVQCGSIAIEWVSGVRVGEELRKEGVKDISKVWGENKRDKMMVIGNMKMGDREMVVYRRVLSMLD